MTEEGRFQRKILKWFEKNKIYAVKYNASGISKAGVPDVVACIDGYFVAIELKKEKGVASDLQKHNVRQINKTGIACVLRPSQFKDFVSIIDYFIIDMSKNRYEKFKDKIINKIGVE